MHKGKIVSSKNKNKKQKGYQFAPVKKVSDHKKMPDTPVKPPLEAKASQPEPPQAVPPPTQVPPFIEKLQDQFAGSVLAAPEQLGSTLAEENEAEPITLQSAFLVLLFEAIEGGGVNKTLLTHEAFVLAQENYKKLNSKKQQEAREGVRQLAGMARSCAEVLYTSFQMEIGG